MKRSLTIAKVAGVPIRLHWSFSLLVVFVALSSPGMSGAQVASYALWLVVLFGSVTLHELSHSVVAMRLGLKVRDIVLLPIGGVSEIEGMGASASVEGRVAIAGPLMSILLGGLFIGLASLTHASLWPPTLSVLGGSWLVRIGWLNLALAAFNLLPALPMDGGRVFRSLLARGGNNLRATRVAAVLAGVLAAAMIGIALVTNDFFLILIGAFVMLGARSEWQGAKLREAVSGVRVGTVMHPETTTVPADVPAEQVAWWLAYYPGRAIPVVDEDGRYLGIVDHHDVAAVPPGTPVASAADREAPVLAPEADLYPSALEAFQLSGRQQLAVVASGRILGVIYRTAVTSALSGAGGMVRSGR